VKISESARRKEGNTMFTPKTILVPTDFSKLSDKAIEKAVDLADKYNARVVLLHVISENVRQCAVDYCINYEDVLRLEEENLNKSLDLMQTEVAGLIGNRHIEVAFDVKKGPPAKVILDEQGIEGADLIVIGSQGKQGFKKHLLGGVADKVVRGARVPVMVVHA